MFLSSAACGDATRERLSVAAGPWRGSRTSRGRRHLIGDRLSALDLYWASFAALVDPLPEDVCAMPGWLRSSYELAGKAGIRIDPALLEQRDWVYETYLELPIDA